MVYKINGEQPFQVLSSDFSISPSESGYELYFSADGFNYSSFATVASGVTRQFTSMNAGNYYKLMGNTGEVSVNWERDCGGGGGGGTAGVSSLDGQTGALTTKTIGGQSILGTGDIPVGGGGDYVIVESLSAITNPTEGMIAYVSEHQETFSGYSISNADGNLYGQINVKHYNPNEKSYMLYEQYDEGFIVFNNESGPSGIGNDGVLRHYFRGSLALSYSDADKEFIVLYKPGLFTVQIGVSQEYYTEISSAVTVPAQMYIYKYGAWRLYEDGKISFYMNTITPSEYDNLPTDIPIMQNGEVQFVVDYEYYGFKTYKLVCNSTSFSNDSFYGSCFTAKATNGDTFDEIKAISIRVYWSSGYKDWNISFVDLAPKS